MSRILITGAGGYIGSVATYLFLNKGYEVVAIDNFSTGYRRSLEIFQEKFDPERFKFYNIDLVRDSLEKIDDFDVVFHYAASCLVDESMRNPAKYFENNVYSSLNLLKAMVESDAKKIFSSTSSVYGEVESVPVDENHSTHSKDVYG